jgi:hypothetical protein
MPEASKVIVALFTISGKEYSLKSSVIVSFIAKAFIVGVKNASEVLAI